jgi:anthranilate phosphoribosyltransferase
VEALGINITLPPEKVAECIDRIGIGFLFAPALHSAWKHAQPVRRELRIRTVFNMLGPLCNPAGASAQVIGIYDAKLVGLAAHALVELGLRRGFVVHGEFGPSMGLDEISTTGPTQIAEVKDGRVRLFTLQPEDAGLVRAVPQNLLGGTLDDNVRILRDIFDGAGGARHRFRRGEAEARVVGGNVSRPLGPVAVAVVAIGWLASSALSSYSSYRMSRP